MPSTELQLYAGLRAQHLVSLCQGRLWLTSDCWMDINHDRIAAFVYLKFNCLAQGNCHTYRICATCKVTRQPPTALPAIRFGQR